ncbi:MAG: hypothetical protein V7672_14790 [Brevundimonas sp.]|uniref:hypothetical protein n=1 Tax=Brevundimonas sp. TaxID=1871086 RepID=UPI00300188C7
MPTKYSPRRDDENAVFIDCFLCRQPFRFGDGIYDGKHVRGWETNFCWTCINGNHDGIVLEYHPSLVSHLKERGIPIRLNARGWLDIPN